MKTAEALKHLDRVAAMSDDEPAIDYLTKVISQIEPEIVATPPPKVRTIDREVYPGREFSIEEQIYVDNAVSTWSWAGHYDIVYPYSLRGVVNAVDYARRHNRRLRCIGARFSYSLVAAATDMYVDLSRSYAYAPETHETDILALDTTPLTLLNDSVATDNLCHLPAGMSIGTINHLLCPENKQLSTPFGRKRLFNMGGTDNQTLAGAISTGTHGTGGRFTALHDMVRSLLIVASDATVYRVEPAEGITDRTQHEAYYRSHPGKVPVTLLQDDDLFNAALVSMGCFGIIYSVVMEVTDMTLLHQDTTYHKYGLTETLKEKLRSGVLPAQEEEEYFYALQINPYQIEPGQPRSCLIKEARPTQKTRVKGRAGKRKFWTTFFARIGAVARLIRLVANKGNSPKKRFIESTLRMQHDAGKQGGGYTDAPYRIWHGGVGKLKAYGVGLEFCFPVDQLPEIMDHFLAMLEQIGARDAGYYLNAPISIRFSRPSRALLANNYYRDGAGCEVKEWCHFEVLRVNSADAEDDRRERELMQHIQRFFAAKGARPHWGLNFAYAFSPQNLRAMYPEFDKWLAAYHFFNRHDVFTNSFTRRAGLDEAVPVAVA